MISNTLYIGIGGHKGSGRSTFTYLLSKVLDYQDINWKNNPSLEDKEFREMVIEAIETINNNPDFLREYGSNNTYITSFSDTMKFYISFMLGVDFQWLTKEENRGRLFINLNTLDIVKDLKEDVIDIKNLQDNDFTNKNISPCSWLSMEDFYTYFMKDIFKKHLGKNIWVKLIDKEDKRDKSYISPYKFKIYHGIKQNNELDFIKDRNGVTIYLNRPTNRKNSKNITTLTEDYDITIDIKGDIYSMIEDIWNVSIILNKTLRNE